MPPKIKPHFCIDLQEGSKLFVHSRCRVSQTSTTRPNQQPFFIFDKIPNPIHSQNQRIQRFQTNCQTNLFSDQPNRELFINSFMAIPTLNNYN